MLQKELGKRSYLYIQFKELEICFQQSIFISSFLLYNLGQSNVSMLSFFFSFTHVVSLLLSHITTQSNKKSWVSKILLGSSFKKHLVLITDALMGFNHDSIKLQNFSDKMLSPRLLFTSAYMRVHFLYVISHLYQN